MTTIVNNQPPNKAAADLFRWTLEPDGPNWIITCPDGDISIGKNGENVFVRRVLPTKGYHRGYLEPNIVAEIARICVAALNEKLPVVTEGNRE